MASNDIYDDHMSVTCTDTGKTVKALVTEFVPGKVATCHLANNKIVMYYNSKHKQYQGSMSGLEFTTQGPKTLGQYR